MGDYQVLFSGEVVADAEVDTVRARLARELGIDDRKARTLFSGRTVVIRSQLDEEEARELQIRLADLGALCRIKSLAAPRAAPHLDKDTLRMEGQHDQTLKDITAAHVECPRCGHLQLEASHCSHCGVDIAAALARKRKEDLLIEKKIRELRSGRTPAAASSQRHGVSAAASSQRHGVSAAASSQRHGVSAAAPGEPHPEPRKRSSFVRDLFRRF